MSWKIAIDSCFEDIKKNLIEYINSDNFNFEWLHWEVHEGRIIGRFRRAIICILGIDDEYDCTFKFLIKTKTLVTILQIIEHSICSQFNLMYKIVSLHIRNNHQKIKRNVKIIINEAFNTVIENDAHEDSLYYNLCNEYKKFWHADEKIQIYWRKCISDPSYIICKKRLKKEFTELL